MDRPKIQPDGIRPGVIVTVAVVVVAVGVLVAGRTLGWFGGAKKPGVESTANATTPAEMPENPPTAPVTAAWNGARPNSSSALPPGFTANAVSIPPVDPAMTDGATADWSTKLDDVLGSDQDETKKADVLLAMWKGLPEEGQIEIMQHISNLLPDEKFPVLAQIFTNVTTSAEVMDIIMTDALNRPNGMKLPALLDVARTPDHPKAEEARDILEVFVDHNFGSDWDKWDQAVKDWLKENPDEPEPPK